MDILLSVILGFFQLALAGLGIYVSLKPQPEKRHSRLIGSFILLGLASVLIGIWQQYQNQQKLIRQENERRTETKNLQDSLNQSRNEQAYMKGQLNSLSLVAGKISQSVSDPGIKQMAGAIEKMAQSIAQTTLVSNKQICSNTLDLVKRMQKFEQSRSARSDQLMFQEQEAMRAAKTKEGIDRLNQYSAQRSQMSANQTYEFRTTLLGEASYLRDELLRRLPPQPKPQKIPAFEGFLVGPYPVHEAAIYLEGLARKLCP